jgi:hypothetical protein
MQRTHFGRRRRENNHVRPRLTRPTRATAVLIIALTIADALTEHTGVYGLFERLVAATMAVALTALGIGILR